VSSIFEEQQGDWSRESKGEPIEEEVKRAGLCSVFLGFVYSCGMSVVLWGRVSQLWPLGPICEAPCFCKQRWIGT
jgi:hypothetical protein